MANQLYSLVFLPRFVRREGRVRLSVFYCRMTMVHRELPVLAYCPSRQHHTFSFYS